MLGVLALLGAAGLGQAENISHSSVGKIEQWQISEPTVTTSNKNYDGILLRPGDTVFVSAGGCVQTGGKGKTWKRYVDPQGANSDRLYHGLIAFTFINRDVPLVRLQDGIMDGPVLIQDFEVLELGYEDDGYGDNGYYAHDDGTNNQCKNVENAWVHLTVIHP